METEIELEKDTSWDILYAKFTHGTLIVDCLESDLKAEMGLMGSKQLLPIYGAYRQVMCGDNTTPQPGVLSVEARLKWESWTKLKGMNRAEALLQWFEHYKKLYSKFPHIFAKMGNSDLSVYQPFQVTDLSVHIDKESALVENEEKKTTCECEALEWLQKKKGEKEGTLLHQLIIDIQKKTNEKQKRFAELEKQWSIQLSEIEQQFNTLKSKVHYEGDKSSSSFHPITLIHRDSWLLSLLSQLKNYYMRKSNSTKRSIMFFFVFILFVLFLYSAKFKRALQRIFFK